jgi:hypothetical protein
VADASDSRDQGKGGSEEVAPSERRAHGYAVAGLNALSALGRDAQPDWGLAQRDDAIKTLTDAVRGGRLGVPRVLVLDALVKLAHRRPDELASAGTRLDDLLLALVEDAGVPAEQQTRRRDGEAGAHAAPRSVLAPSHQP